MKNLLAKAKENGIKAFYKNLDDMKKESYPETQFDNYEDFQAHVKQLKENKRKE